MNDLDKRPDLKELVQILAERAWRSPGKSITVGKVTVKVRAFKH